MPSSPSLLSGSNLNVEVAGFLFAGVFPLPQAASSLPVPPAPSALSPLASCLPNPRRITPPFLLQILSSCSQAALSLKDMFSLLPGSLRVALLRRPPLP